MTPLGLIDYCVSVYFAVTIFGISVLFWDCLDPKHGRQQTPSVTVF
jgi:hypothetical protein